MGSQIFVVTIIDLLKFMMMKEILKVLSILILSFLVFCGCYDKNLRNESAKNVSDDYEETTVEESIENAEATMPSISTDELANNTKNSNNLLKWKWVVEPGVYEDVFFVDEDLIAVEDDEGKCKIINTTGEDVFHNEFDSISEFSNDVALIRINGKVTYINHDGKTISEKTYQDGYSFSESLGAVEQNDKWGFIRLDGTIAVEYKYEEVKPFHEHYAAIKLNDKWGFIDDLGKIVIQPEFDEVEDFHEGIAAVKLNRKWGFVDSNNSIIADFVYDMVKNFNEGYAAVMKDGKWGFINSSGSVCISLKYDDASNFSEGKAAVKLDNYIEGMDAWGYIDNEENTVLNYYPYDASEGRMIWVGEFKDGKAFVSKTLYTIIDSEGNNIFNVDSEFFISVLEYNEEFDAVPGYIFTDEIMKNQKYGLVGLNGECRLEPVFDYVNGIRGSYVMVENMIDGNFEKGIIEIYNE